MAISRSAVGNQNDSVLLPFLSEADETQSETSLAQIIFDHTESTIKHIIRSKLRVSLSNTDGSYPNQEALDLLTEVQSALLAGLRDLKVKIETKTISNFHSYVATVTFNACHHWLRRKYPRRFQLKNKLRYLLTHEAEFALWECDREWVCGLAEWRGEQASLSAVGELQRRRDRKLRLPNAAHANRPHSNRQALVALISTTFERSKGAVLFDELVSLMIDQLQIQEDIIVAEDERPVAPGQGRDSAMQLESQAQLSQLWKEICQLPLRHRRALLLNLRDRKETDALELFLMTGVATIRAIGSVLDFQPEEFARIWNELPWDDLTIANHLGLTRQQVINLRQSARAKLARRLNRVH